MFHNAYQDKRVFLTGHTGFKGAWLALWLKRLGATVYGYSLPAPTQPSLYECVRSVPRDAETIADLADLPRLQQTLDAAKPDIVFHLAAQPLVRASYVRPLETLSTNVVGTANVLEAVRLARRPCAVLVVTTDKCYENRETGQAYAETDPLGGHDIYSASKAAAEIMTQAWRRSFFQVSNELGPVATARGGNVIGGGDYGGDRIVPDCLRALMAAQTISVRNPQAVRPWQHVLDCLSGYLWLGAKLLEPGAKTTRVAGAFNFGPAADAPQTVRTLVEEILKHWPGQWQDAAQATAPHEAKWLSLSTTKAKAVLGWSGCLNLAETVQYTVNWYRERHVAGKADMAGFSGQQIEAYEALAGRRAAVWAAQPTPKMEREVSA